MPFDEKTKDVLENNMKKEEKNVLVGIRIDSESWELLDWALVKIAEPGDCVVAIHVCQSSDHALKKKPLLDAYLEVYEGLCSEKKVGLTGEVLIGRSVRKTLVREAKSCAAAAVIVGISKRRALRGRTSMARSCSKQLPPSTDVLTMHNGKIVFRRCNNNQLPGLNGDPRPSFCRHKNSSVKDYESEYGDSETGTDISSFEVTGSSKQESRDSGGGETKDEMLNIVYEDEEVSSRTSSHFVGDFLEPRPGWPLLRKHSPLSPQPQLTQKMSVVQWVMSLPDRSLQQKLRSSTFEENPLENESSHVVGEDDSHTSSVTNMPWTELDIPPKPNPPGCKWFSYEILRTATSQFSSENLIGKGGSNCVYKGTLPDGKLVAIKILRTSKEAQKDFAHEVEIISSVKHKNITPLIGICVKDNDLISVYDFSSKGSLEDNLHGKEDKHALSWGTRFNIAIGVAEAINYLHTECPRPVIHRDIKSSNILLSDGFEPQLSDFGLAIWGPTTSSFLTQSDVVGTFGYLAPEYFMYGKVSDKVDVYAFGVVLLELLSGREPICSETSKGEESLVMWARPRLESGNVKGILDPDLNGKFDEVQMQRMVLAATLCLTRASRLRPKIREILKLLRGENDVEKGTCSRNEDQENQDGIDDEVYPNSSAELHLSLAMLDVDDDSIWTSFSSMEQRNSLYLDEYLKDRWSRSSSFD
ncbi:probable receptor-like protein kinase At3g17420 [Carica papaya]|uniref:probable receptor-like protein kinase At3g17420 n=1 Tax=Carica papaya TaxID=3649 RepID=UPI000B8CF12A|nr:probable receptor-like protein kinase At3g17420 [Carica papaya]